jgi:hypothetical protein
VAAPKTVDLGRPIKDDCSNLPCEVAMPEGLFDKFYRVGGGLATMLVAVSSEWIKQRGQNTRIYRKTDHRSAESTSLPPG